MPTRIRTFIAVDLAPAVHARCLGLQQTLARVGVSGDVKWVDPDNLHITLLFLGEIDEREVTDVCSAVADTCAGIDPFHVRVEGVGAFPNTRRPRIVWAGVGAGSQGLVALHDALEPPLLALGCYRREDRAYTPHVTLGRTRGDGPAADASALSQAIEKQAAWQGGEYEVSRVQVMASELQPSGLVYSVLSTAPLRGAPPAAQQEQQRG